MALRHNRWRFAPAPPGCNWSPPILHPPWGGRTRTTTGGNVKPSPAQDALQSGGFARFSFADRKRKAARVPLAVTSVSDAAPRKRSTCGAPFALPAGLGPVGRPEVPISALAGHQWRSLGVQTQERPVNFRRLRTAVPPAPVMIILGRRRGDAESQARPARALGRAPGSRPGRLPPRPRAASSVLSPRRAGPGPRRTRSILRTRSPEASWSTRRGPPNRVGGRPRLYAELIRRLRLQSGAPRGPPPPAARHPGAYPHGDHAAPTVDRMLPASARQTCPCSPVDRGRAPAPISGFSRRHGSE